MNSKDNEGAAHGNKSDDFQNCRLATREGCKEDRDQNVEDGVPDKIEEKEVNKGFWAFLPQPLDSQILRLFTHRDHKAALSVVLQKEARRSINLAVKAHKGLFHKAWNIGNEALPPGSLNLNLCLCIHGRHHSKTCPVAPLIGK